MVKHPTEDFYLRFQLPNQDLKKFCLRGVRVFLANGPELSCSRLLPSHLRKLLQRKSGQGQVLPAVNYKKTIREN